MMGTGEIGTGVETGAGFRLGALDFRLGTPSRIGGILIFLLMCAAAADAQQRPLVTEDPETVGVHRVLVEGGFEIDKDQFYSAYGVKGDTIHGPTFGVSVGISPSAEIQVDGGLFQRLTVNERGPRCWRPSRRSPGTLRPHSKISRLPRKFGLPAKPTRIRRTASGSAPGFRLQSVSRRWVSVQPTFLPAFSSPKPSSPFAPSAT